MTYKDLLVIVDARPQCRARLALATRLAERFDAHLVGLHVTLAPDSDLWTQDGSHPDEAKALFEAAVAGRSISAEWRLAIGSPARLAALHGRYADLVVVGQVNPDDPAGQPRPEEIALLTGRPILVVPYAGSFTDCGRHVLVGWDASREATRAANDAMPLLAAASEVTVLSIDPRENSEGHGEVPGADISLHLARHGVAATVESTVSDGIGVGDVLLSRASDLDADLLVMGAYGHSRAHERLFGGATRTVLATMTIPVFMAH